MGKLYNLKIFKYKQQNIYSFDGIFNFDAASKIADKHFYTLEETNKLLRESKLKRILK